jgi:hypothetical protein
MDYDDLLTLTAAIIYGAVYQGSGGEACAPSKEWCVGQAMELNTRVNFEIEQKRQLWQQQREEEE